MRRRVEFIAVLLIAVIPLGLTALTLPGCASMGFAPAQSVDEKLAYAMGVHSGILGSIADAATARSITGAEGKALLGMADDARQLLDVAKSINDAGDINGAAQRLELASQVLKKLQDFLAKKGV